MLGNMMEVLRRKTSRNFAKLGVRLGLLTSHEEDTYYEYLKRQHRLATKMELNDENVIAVLEELLPYIEADGGWLEYVETDYTAEGAYVKVRLGGACSTCAMSSITLKQGIEAKLMDEIPDVKGVIQVL